MPYEPASRYPEADRDEGRPGTGVMIDGLDVVEDQVVVLSPVEPHGPRQEIGRPPRRRRGYGHGVG